MVWINGVKIGIAFNKTLKLGIGINYLFTNLNHTICLINLTDSKIYNTHLRLNYAELYSEYVFFQNHHWEISIPAQLGLGKSFYRYANNGNVIKFQNQWVSFIETNLCSHYKFFYWFGIGIGIGYRKLIYSEKKMDENFNAPIGILKIKIFVYDLYRKKFVEHNKN